MTLERPPVARLARLRLTRPALVAAGTALAAAIGWAAATTATDTDRAPGISAVFGWVGRLGGGITWSVVTCLIAVSICHHIAASVAVRAAAGVELPFVELVGVQYAAAAANRVTPAGLGSAGVTSRFLTRRGRLTGSQSAAAVSALALLGGTADAAAFAALIGVGAALGWTGTTGEVPLLLARLGALLPAPHGSLRWLLIALAVVAVALLGVVMTRRKSASRRAAAAVRGFGAGLAGLARRPLGLFTMMAGSASTTLVLAAGFAAAATLGPAGLPPHLFAAMMVGYMAAAAAANALPTPGGIGSADAALTGVLLAAHVPGSAAVATALAYRAVTFWAPAAVGLALVRPLRRRGAL